MAAVIPTIVSDHKSIDVVWSEAKQVGLIDSLLRNYYIPPVIFGKSYFLLSPASN